MGLRLVNLILYFCKGEHYTANQCIGHQILTSGYCWGLDKYTNFLSVFLHISLSPEADYHLMQLL